MISIIVLPEQHAVVAFLRSGDVDHKFVVDRELVSLLQKNLLALL